MLGLVPLCASCRAACESNEPVHGGGTRWRGSGVLEAQRAVGSETSNLFQVTRLKAGASSTPLKRQKPGHAWVSGSPLGGGGPEVREAR